MIGVIDYKAGNGPSVLNALNNLNIEASLVSTSEQIEGLSAIILPGVGSAEATVSSLKEMNFLNAIEDMVLNRGVPFMGICIGLQVLFEHSEEGDVDCLGWIHGSVKKFSERAVRVPQIGWNEACFTQNHPILNGLNKSEYFYFVNSYYVEPNDKSIILAETEYGAKFCSMISYKNIIASQFHIEKSGVVGLKILRNFGLIAGGNL